MNYATIKHFDISNGPGVRMSLYVSGCTHHCKGCFNTETWDFNSGKPFTEEVKKEFIKACKDENITAVSILGGDPLQQNHLEMLDLLKEIKTQVNKPIWLWTGYKLEELGSHQKQMLENFVDVLIDGKFEIDKKDITLKYCGSTNQRVIDIKETFKHKEIRLYEKA